MNLTPPGIELRRQVAALMARPKRTRRVNRSLEAHKRRILRSIKREESKRWK